MKLVNTKETECMGEKPDFRVDKMEVKCPPSHKYVMRFGMECPSCSETYSIEMRTDMISKDTAIKMIHKIQEGEMNKEVDVPKGRIVEELKLWTDDNFRYGMEYGAIVILMDMFDISKDEL